jgi:hypothetical protein
MFVEALVAAKTGDLTLPTTLVLRRATAAASALWMARRHCKQARDGGTAFSTDRNELRNAFRRNARRQAVMRTVMSHGPSCAEKEAP